jgi:ABC-type polysaccharide/polyol phosphate export permease
MFEKWRSLILINPVAPVLEGLRSCVVLQQPPDLVWTSYSAILALLFVTLAVSAFTRLEPLFAESI